MLNQLRDDTSRYKSEAELSKQTTNRKQQQAEVLTITTLSESKLMGLDTVAISIGTEEESTPVGLVIVAKDGAGSDQVCLDTATTSSTTTVENRQVGLTTVVKVVDETGTGTEWTQCRHQMTLAKHALQFALRQRKVLLQLTKKTHGCTHSL
jgi:hypothetical protein